MRGDEPRSDRRVDYNHHFRYHSNMSRKLTTKVHDRHLPIFVEKDEDGFYIVECPILRGCFTQGKTLDEAMRNIREVIALILEEPEARVLVRDYRPREVSLHTITV